MPIARISGPGLAAIALCVAALWGVVIAQRIAARKAIDERARVMQEIRLLQQRRSPEPVSSPVPFRRAPRRMIAS